MIRRPMCLLLLLLVSLILLMEGSGLSQEGAKAPDPLLTEAAKENKRVLLEGILTKKEAGKDRDTSIFYIKSKYLAVSGQNSQKKSKKQYRQWKGLEVRVLVENKELLKICRIGNRLRITGSLFAVPKASNQGQFDREAYYRRQGIEAHIKGRNVQVLGKRYDFVKEYLYGLRKRQLSYLERRTGKEAGSLAAILLGDKSLLDEDTREAYLVTGMIHILAISGTHLTLLGMFLKRLCLKAGISRGGAGILASLLMIAYGIFTGAGVSTLRAVCMFSVSNLAELLGRSYDLLSAASLAAVLLLLSRPSYLWDGGFLLTFSALAGLSLLVPLLGRGRQALKGAFGIWLLQLPIMLGLFYKIPLFSFPMNLLLLPLFPLLLASGMAGLLLGGPVPTLGEWLLYLPRFLLLIYRVSGEELMKLPRTMLTPGCPSRVQIISYYSCLLIVFCVAIWKEKKGLIYPGALLACLLLFWRPEGSFRLTMVDVGQGDCFLLEAGQDGNFLIDGGSSSSKKIAAYRIEPLLSWKGITSLDGVFVTHRDGDHINGIEEILKAMDQNKTSIRIKALFLPTWMRDEEDKDQDHQLETLAAAAGVPLLYLARGDKICQGKLAMEVLHPGEGRGYEDENEGSMVLRIEYEDFSALMTGDLGMEGEKELLKTARRELLEADLLKLGHHGSKNSTSEKFLEAVSPDLALLSVGKGNPYGHPAREVLEKLERRRIPWLASQDFGQVTVEVKDKGDLRVRTFKEGWLGDNHKKPRKNIRLGFSSCNLKKRMLCWTCGEGVLC